MSTRISIITATLNNAEGLERTLQSIAAQTYDNIEHIVVDGNSTDSTTALLSRHPEAKVVSARPAGVYDALNHGVAFATGDIVGILHAGDTFTSPDILTLIAEAFADNSTDFIFGDIHFTSRRTGRTVRRYSAQGFRTSMLRQGFAPPHPSLYMRLKLAQRPGFSYKTNYVIAGDFDLFLRLYADKSLSWRYLPLDMVEMETGGIATKWHNRLFVNNKEKLRALRENGMKSSLLSTWLRYFRIIKSILNKK